MNIRSRDHMNTVHEKNECRPLTLNTDRGRRHIRTLIVIGANFVESGIFWSHVGDG